MSSARHRLARRRFVQLGASALLGAGMPARGRAAASRRRVLCIQLDGGLDGLSLLPPLADAEYLRLRPQTALPGALALDAVTGLHPALAALEPLYRQGRLLALASVGLPPGAAEAAVGHARARAALNAALRAKLGAVCPLERAAELLPGQPSMPRGVRGDYPQSTFGARLARFAEAMDGGLSPEVVLVPLGGFDTHLAQRARLSALLGELGQGLSALWAELGEGRRELVVVVLSEQGRSLCENRTAGTDDGLASAALLLGESIAGGRVLSHWPPLADLRARGQRALPVELDLSRVLGELAGASRALGLFRAGDPGA